MQLLTAPKEEEDSDNSRFLTSVATAKSFKAVCLKQGLSYKLRALLIMATKVYLSMEAQSCATFTQTKLAIVVSGLAKK